MFADDITVDKQYPNGERMKRDNDDLLPFFTQIYLLTAIIVGNHKHIPSVLHLTFYELQTKGTNINIEGAKRLINEDRMMSHRLKTVKIHRQTLTDLSAAFN